jgi:hypothetical protein
MFGQNLDSDGAIQAGVAPLIDRTEAASADRAENFVCAELCPRSECHVRCRIIRLLDLFATHSLSTQQESLRVLSFTADLE